MSQVMVIAKRELMSLFFSPIAYVVLGLFGLGTTLIFLREFDAGAAASMRGTFFGLVWLMVFLVPAISMRLLAEEYRSGTIEPLMTSPISDEQVVIGKWLGGMGFMLAILIPIFILYLVLELHGNPELGPMLTGVIGLLLVAGFYLAIGTFASAASQNQIIAFVLTVFIISLLTFGMYYLPQARFVGPNLREAMLYMNVNTQFEDFNKGLLDLRNVVYFGTGIAFFLFVAVKLLESRRWR